MAGQLYLVKTRGQLKETGAIEKSVFIVTASSSGEVQMKIPYFIDQGEYSQFSIKGIDRIKPNFHLVERRILLAEESVAATELEGQLQSDGKDCGHSESPTLQERNRLIFAFGLIGHVIGRDQRHVLRRLSDFLVKKSMGANCDLPFVDSGHFIVEALGEADGPQSARLSRNEPYEFQGGRIVVQGGGCSPR